MVPPPHQHQPVEPGDMTLCALAPTRDYQFHRNLINKSVQEAGGLARECEERSHRALSSLHGLVGGDVKPGESSNIRRFQFIRQEAGVLVGRVSENYDQPISLEVL